VGYSTIGSSWARCKKTVFTTFRQPLTMQGAPLGRRIDVATRGGATHPSVHPAEVRRCRPTHDSESISSDFIFGHFGSV
jgi:hypothetical protein